jgi:hypothetical protein
MAAFAGNAKIDSGALVPWDGTAFHSTPTKIGVKKSIYRWGAAHDNPNSGFWFHWTSNVHVVNGAVNQDTIERTYFTGDGVPKMTFAGIATAGGTNYPTNSYTLGVPAPNSGCTAALVGTPDPGADPDTDTVERYYQITYLTAQGEEGPTSIQSNTVSWLPGQTVDLTLIPGAPVGNYNVTHARIYRTASGASGAAMYFVAQVSIGTANYSDAILDSGLGDILESETYYPPPTDMHSIGVLSSGMFYGFSGKDVCVSELYLPHAWTPSNQLTLPDQIIGGGSFGNTIVAVTKKNPFIITGIDPQSVSADEYKINQGCLSNRGCVSSLIGVLYPSPDGLILVGPNGTSNITEPYLTIDQWQWFKPDSILGVMHDGKYFGFYDNGTQQGGFIIDPSGKEPGFMTTSIFATAAYRDPLLDSLFLVVGDDIVKWGKGSPLTATWRSKEFTFGRAKSLTVGRVLASNYASVTAMIYADGVLKHTQIVTDDQPFRFPGGYKARTYQFDIVTTATVHIAEFASTPIELSAS